MSDAAFMYDPIDIHAYFSLSYANYLVLHRSILQSMPLDWQHKFVALLMEIDDVPFQVERPFAYRVQPVDERGRYAKETIPYYDRGRTLIPHE